MPTVIVPVQLYAQFKVAPVWTTPDQSDTRIPNNGSRLVLLENRGGAAVTVTIHAVNECDHGDLHDEVLVLGNTADTRIKVIPRLDTHRFNAVTDRRARLSFDVDPANVRVAVMDL